jgi:hypothetical protein
VTVAPGVFQLDDENKASSLLNGADAENLLAAQTCSQAIILYDEEENRFIQRTPSTRTGPGCFDY